MKPKTSLKLLFAIAILCCSFSVRAVDFLFTNYNAAVLTNTPFQVFPVSLNTNNGSYIVVGLPIRIPATNGIATNVTLLRGNYELKFVTAKNQNLLTDTFLFEVETDGDTNNVIDLRIPSVSQSGGAAFRSQFVLKNGGSATNLSVTSPLTLDGTNILDLVGEGGSGGQPASANLTNWSALQTNQFYQIASNTAAIALALTNLNEANIFFVETNGNDATAVKGDRSKPGLTITNAITKVSSNNMIQAGYGIFDFVSNTVAIPPGVIIRGMGPRATIFTAANNGATNAIIRPTTNTILSELTLRGTSTGYQYLYGKHSADAQLDGTNILHNVRIEGDSDGLYFDSATNAVVIVDGLDSETKFDNIIIQGGLRNDIRVFNSRLKASEPSAIGTGANFWHSGLRMNAGTSNSVSLQNVYIENRGTNNNRGIYIPSMGTGDTLTLDNVVFDIGGGVQNVELYGVGRGVRIGNIARVDGGEPRIVMGGHAIKSDLWHGSDVRRVVTGSVSNWFIVSGGTGYTEEDIITLTGGTTSFSFTNYNTDVITDVEPTLVISRGSGYTNGIYTGTGGTGTGFELAVVEVQPADTNLIISAHSLIQSIPDGTETNDPVTLSQLNTRQPASTALTNLSAFNANVPFVATNFVFLPGNDQTNKFIGITNNVVYIQNRTNLDASGGGSELNFDTNDFTVTGGTNVALNTNLFFEGLSVVETNTGSHLTLVTNEDSSLSLVVNTNDLGVGSQTPWLSDIDGGNTNSLTNVMALSVPFLSVFDDSLVRAQFARVDDYTFKLQIIATDGIDMFTNNVINAQVSDPETPDVIVNVQTVNANTVSASSIGGGANAADEYFTSINADVPTGPGDSGVTGAFKIIPPYLYVCTDTDTWIRIDLDALKDVSWMDP